MNGNYERSFFISNNVRLNLEYQKLYTRNNSPNKKHVSSVNTYTVVWLYFQKIEFSIILGIGQLRKPKKFGTSRHKISDGISCVVKYS